MKSIGLLVLRLVYGGLLAGHGSQKLFGWFGGYGLKGTSQWLDSLGLEPGDQMAKAAVASEFGGGLLTALGFLNPVGPLLSMGSMAIATLKVHWGKPIWVSEGGAELPITNLAIATALALAGPGKLSLDGLLGTHLPRWLIIPGVLANAAGVALALAPSQAQQQQANAAQGIAPAASDQAEHAALA
ncbi:MAG: DoxX family protein [Ktedonobacterales bacterium]